MTTSVAVMVPEHADYKAVVVAVDAQPNGPSASFRVEVTPGNSAVFHAHATRVIEVSEESIEAVEATPARQSSPARNDTEAAIEQTIQAKGLNAPRLTPELIDAAIAAEAYHVFPGTTLTVCALTLRNGFIVIGTSAAASPENFDEVIGRDIARRNARERIWELEGYLLRQRLHDAAPRAPRFEGADAVEVVPPAA